MDKVTIGDATIYCADAREGLRALPDASVQCVVTSPPYWGLRDYGVQGQIGLEPTLPEFVEAMTEVFREVSRVLRADGTVWLNMGDAYAGGGRGGNPEESAHRKQATNTGSVTGAAKDPGKTPAGLKPKDLCGIPWRVAFALQDAGWYLRQDIIWHKPNPMPESVTDRCTKAHEYIFLLSKSVRYYYDSGAIKEISTTGDVRKPYGSDGAWSMDGRDKWAEGAGQPRANAKLDTRNKRSVWTVTVQPFPGAHFATFPPKLIEPCILAGCPPDGIVLDPFHGAGTTGMVALQQGRKYIGIELNPEYVELSLPRLQEAAGQQRLFA